MKLFKTKFCWWPVRMARFVPVKVGFVAGKDVLEDKMEYIGWVWWRTAHLSYNLVDCRWVAFLDATPLTPRCSKCGQTLPEK